MEKHKQYRDIPDMFYPSAEKREELNRRRLSLNSDHPCTYLNDLMTEYMAGMICRRNPQNVMKLFREMCSDKEVMNFRLDAFEDILNCPKLSPYLHKAARTLLDCTHDLAGAGNPDSFTALSSTIAALSAYIECMDGLHDFYGEVKNKIRSCAFRELFEGFEERCCGEEYASMKQDISELKEAFSKKIRSVTVAINFNSDMKPVSAGITGWSDKPAGEKPNVFDRIFYKNAAHPDTYVMGRLRSGQPNEDGFISESDKALFESLEKITSAYMGRLRSALVSWERLSYDRISMLEDQLEIFDGMARICETAEARGLRMCRPEFADEPRNADIKGLFDPCLFFKTAASMPDAKGDELIVRNDLAMNDEGRFFILTGANNGGKTTFVRGAGLCQLMAQTGFYVPAESCRLSICDFIFTHFPKEEETGINASRFTTEIKDIKRICGLAGENSLLLMNESIQSTTPRECSEIAAEIVRIFCIIGVRGIFATHITELAELCDDISADPDCRSIPVSIAAKVDEESGRRLYRIEKGAPPKQSYAADIFRAFGISTEEVRKRKNGKR